MNFLKKSLLFVLAIMPISVQAATYTQQGTITRMTVGKDYARVKMSNITKEENCSKHDWYIISFTDGGSTEMYSMLLTAKATNQKVSFQLTGCKFDYPKITHIYN